MSYTGIYTGPAPYQQLAEVLRRELDEGRHFPGMQISSERELGRQHNLSRMTVRKAVQLLVDEGLVERKPGVGIFVRDRDSETRVVNMMAGNLSWEPAVRISRAARDVAREHGIALQLNDAQGRIDDDLTAIRRLPASGARGAIIMSLHCPPFFRALSELRVAGFPFVVVDQHLREIDAPSVASDNQAGGRLIGQHLVEVGHRQIAFLGDLEADTTQDRLLGLRERLAEAGYPLNPRLIADVQGQDRFGDWLPEVETAVIKLMQRQRRPTALVCSCDAVARSVYRVLARLKLRIPQDISVTGFDDDPLAEWLSPGLTTIQQQFSQIGRVAMELLLQRIVNPALPAEHRALPVKLIERKSVAAPITEKPKRRARVARSA